MAAAFSESGRFRDLHPALIYLGGVLRWRWLPWLAWLTSLALSSSAAAAEPDRDLALRWAVAAHSSAAEAPPEALAELYRSCGQPHPGLVRVARHVAKQVATGRGPDPGPLLAQRVRAAGVPHPEPRAWALTGAHEPDAVAQRLASWLADRPMLQACGVAIRGAGEHQIVAVVTTPALASMQPFPLRTSAYRWQTLAAQVRLPVASASVVLLGPHGAPHRVPASLQHGRIKARFRLDRPGRWLVQLVGELADGPRPLLTIETYVDAEPPATLSRLPAEAVASEAILLRRINGERRRAGRLPLALDGQLTELARQHAHVMAVAGRVAHDVGQGYPNERAARAGLDGSRIGENVARAASLGGLLQAWWDSPSHRDNLLDGRFRTVGLGVAHDSRGRHYGALMLMR